MVTRLCVQLDLPPSREEHSLELAEDFKLSYKLQDTDLWVASNTTAAELSAKQKSQSTVKKMPVNEHQLFVNYAT